jgi:hypothetical protein
MPHRSRCISSRACAIAIGLALTGALVPLLHPYAELSAEAKSKILRSLDQSGRNSLLVFDQEGNTTKHHTLSADEINQSRSLIDFAEKDPIASCKEPKPVPDLPLCVLCKSGKHVCSKAAFTGSGSALEPQ